MPPPMSEDKPESILNEAYVATHGERNVDYGDPHQNHMCTAGLWNAYLTRRFGVTAVWVTPRDVCLMNALQKISRDANRAKRDNLVDIAGYADNAQRCQDVEDARCQPAPDVTPDSSNGTDTLRAHSVMPTLADVVKARQKTAAARHHHPSCPKCQAAKYE